MWGILGGGNTSACGKSLFLSIISCHDILQFTIFVVHLHHSKAIMAAEANNRSIRLTVRTADSHSANTSSILVWSTGNNGDRSVLVAVFCCVFAGLCAYCVVAYVWAAGYS